MQNDLINMLKEAKVYNFIIKNYYQTKKSLFFDVYEKHLLPWTFTALYKPGFKNNSQKYRPNSKFKLHYAVDHRDLEKASEIIGLICSKYNIPGFKFVNYPFGQSTLNAWEMPSSNIPPHEQDGKDFTIYIGKGQDNPEFMRYFTQLIEHNFIKHGIRPANKLGRNILLGDKQIKGSIYGFYRYPDNEQGIENPKHNFIAPRNGDFMDQVSVYPQSSKTMVHFMPIDTKDEAEEVQNVLNKLGIPFSIQKNDELACKKNPDIPAFKLFHKDPYAIQKLASFVRQDSLKNTFAEELDNSTEAQHVQHILKKIGISSRRIQPFNNAESPKRIVFCSNNQLIKNLMSKIEIDHISQMDAAMVSSQKEANKLCLFFKQRNIPIVKTGYYKEDGTIQYTIVYKKDPKIDQMLKNLNINFQDEKNPNYALKQYAQQKAQKIV